MKNFLSKLWSLSRADRVRTLAIDAVSLPSFCRVNMLKLVSVLVLILTIGSGNAWAGVRSGWTRVTTVKEITDGGTFIVGWENSANSNTIVPMINKPAALSGVGSKSNSYLYSGTASTSNNTTIDMSDKGSGATTNYEFEIVTGSADGKIAIKLSDNTYVGFWGSSNNNCKRCASVCDSSSFTPTIATNDIVTLTNVKFTGRKLKFNNSSGSYRFSNYSSAEKMVLYKKTSSCSKSVAVTKGSESHGEVTTIGSASVATCSSTASDRQVTITVTPDDCYDAPSTLTWTKSSGTVTATKRSGPTDNGNGTFSYVYEFNQNDNGAGTFGVTCTAKDPGKTVNFDAGPGSCLISSLTENCDGSGVTLPAVTASGVCKGWTTFAGWATAAVSDSTTTSGVTLYAAGSKFVPASNGQTLYAVYSKNKGGSGFKLSLVVSSTTYYVGKQNGSNNYLSAETNSANAAIFTFDNGYLSYDDSGTKKYISITGNNTSLYVTTDKPAVTWTESGTTTYSYLTSAATRYLAYNGSASPVRFASYNNNSSYPQYFTKTSTATIYYCSDPNCCTQLASINGSFSFTSVGTTGATANWGWTGATTGISKNILKVYKESDNSLVATIDNISASATSQAITGLDPCTEYYVKLSTVSSGGGYCDGVADQTGASHVTFTTSSYTVTKTGVTNVTAASLSAIPATTCASGFGPITIEAASGYVLPAEITVTGASHTWNQASGALTISSVTGNVSITITPTAASCSSFSFHTGTGEDATVKTTNTTTCFSQVNSSTTWKIDNYVIPADTKFFVGERGFFYDDNLGSNNSRSAVKTWAQEMFFEYTKNYGDGYRPTVGQATGAIGTLYIWSDNNWNNLHVGFSPQGYVFKLGSTNLSMSGSATLDANRYWETEVITLTSTDISGNYQANLYTGSTGGVASNNTQSTAVNTMGVKTNAGDNWRGTAINAGADANTRGFFRIDIGDGGTKNWHAHWVPTHRVIFHSNYPGGGGPADTYSVDVSVEETNNSIALASAPSNPTGYTFAGWYDAADGGNHITTARTISAGASANVELWAHWTANTIALTLDKNNNDASGSTSGSASILFDGTAVKGSPAMVAATRTGHSVEGYYSDAACTAANKVLDASGNVINSTVSGYTTSGKWTRATTPTTLYTKWTPNNYTVTWYAGGTDAGNITTEGSPTTSVAYGSKVTTLPTDPDGAACDKTFVGWTNTTSYVHGTSPLFNDVAGSPTINADASFYAVFATGGTDYELVTSSSTALAAGDEIIFVSSATAGSAYAMGYQNTNNRPQVSVTIASGPKITSPTLATSTSDNTNIYPFILEANDGAFAIKENITGGRYLKADGAGSSGNNYLHSASETTPNTTTEKFTISIAPSTSIATITGGNTANNARNVMQYNSGSSIFSCYASASQSSVYIYRKGYSGHTIICSDCGTSVTPTFTAAPTGGTVAVTKGGSAVTSGDAVKTCTSQDLSVTITPAPHYTLTGFTATGLSTGTATISPVVAETLPKTTETTFTVTVSAEATGTLNLTPTFTEDAHVAINWNVNGVNQSIAATEGLTWVYSGGDLTALPSTPSVPAGCSGTKVFAGWSEKHSDATEKDASYYDDLFTAVGDAPTGISSEKTFYAVFATSSANPLAGEVMWDEPWTGTSDKTTPSSPSSGATVYNSTSLTYAYTNGNTTTQVYADGTMYSGGAAAPELLISKTSPSGVWTVTNIPTGGSAQTELTLSYKTNKTTIAVTSGTSGITIGDATVDGNTYTHTITISHSPSTINNFSLIFTNTGSANARIDDIHLVVPGSGTMTDYVTLCAPSWTITYNKNTEDAVTNLPSPTSVLQSTGSGTLSSTVPERATYTFSGWSETTSGAVAYVAGGSITGVTGDKTLYAVWVKTPVEELTLNYSELNKYVGDAAVTLEVTGVTPAGADATVTWSSNNSTVASVVAATGVVTFGTVGTATITATSTVTGTTTAYCYVTVRNKPTATFVDLIHDGNGTDLSTYHMQNVAGTAIVFPTLDDYATPGDDCDSKHYVFVGWTTSDNNDDPEDNLVTSDELEDDQDKVFYAVWADGVEGVSYTKLTTNSFKTSPTKYVIGAEYNGDTYYFYSCAATDENNGNGGCTTSPATNAPIQFTLSGTADALVATSTEASARYLKPLTGNNFQMSATTKTIALSEDGDILNASATTWALRFNTSNKYLRWYNTAPGSAAYFYEVTAGAAVSYRTSCCTNNVPAPTVVATNTAYTVTLTWAAVVGATGYEVSWNGGAFEAATSPCVKSGLTASTDYIYKVRATYDPLVKCGALVASGNVTTDDVYTVTYSGGTGTGSCSPSGSVAPASYEAGAIVTLAPTNSYSMTSNTFAAWVVKDADDNDVPVSNNQFTMPAKNVTVTATWTAVQDKYYDRMHDGTDALHGGFADGEGKYYLVLEGCNYTVPTLTDDDDGDTDCHTTHYKLLGWIAYSHLKTDGSGQIKPGEESYIFQGGGTKSATGATYYAVWAIMTE